MSDFSEASVGAPAIQTVLEAIRSHPEGITVARLMLEHKWTNERAVLAAVNLLQHRGVIRVEVGQDFWLDYLESKRVYPI